MPGNTPSTTLLRPANIPVFIIIFFPILFFIYLFNYLFSLSLFLSLFGFRISGVFFLANLQICKIRYLSYWRTYWERALRFIGINNYVTTITIVIVFKIVFKKRRRFETIYVFIYCSFQLVSIFS